MKKLLIALMMSCGVVAAANSAVVANLDYIHKAIQAEWGFFLPYNDEVSSTMAAANMKYLLHAMDETNWTVNSEDISDYAEDPLATMLAADKDATDKAVVDLIDVRGLTFRTTTDTTYFEIKIAAKGTFTIKWGDGTNETFTQDTTDQVTYSHTYDTAEAHYIKLLGKATEYNSGGDLMDFEGFNTLRDGELRGSIPAITFGTKANVYKIYNSLGSVFPTLADGTQPSFNGFCSGCSNLVGPIPENLFEGLSGPTTRAYMFASLFQNCSKLNGDIPENLFANVSGQPTTGMFSFTFSGCKALTGTIPKNLFAKIDGKPTTGIFRYTFNSCSGLKGPLPSELFANIKGEPAAFMFHQTFALAGLRSSTGQTLPADLFAGIEGAPAHKMFHGTFESSGINGNIPDGLFAGIEGQIRQGIFEATFHFCRGLYGRIPENLFKGLTHDGSGGDRAFAYAFAQTGGLTIPENLFTKYDENGKREHGIEGPPMTYMFQGTFIDSGIGNLPPKLFAGIRGAPAEGMFNSTFHYNSIGDIPEGFFDGIEGEPAVKMFSGTFDTTWGITKIPKGLFAKISGPAAESMFSGTFSNSTALVNIGYDAATGTSGHPIFGNITGNWVPGMFSNTFSGDTKLASDSAKMTVITENEDGSTSSAIKYLYEVFTPSGDANTYNGATGLKDYANIPDNWK